jgi:hypothetical protein
MSVHSIRRINPATDNRDDRFGEAMFEPILPALIRGAVFLMAIATPFIAALLML